MVGNDTPEEEVAPEKGFPRRRTLLAVLWFLGCLGGMALLPVISFGSNIPIQLSLAATPSLKTVFFFESGFHLIQFSLMIIVGLWITRFGFKNLRAKRTVADIPTSSIKTGAVGTNVEIKGKILLPQGKTFTTPVSKTPSSYYELEIYKLCFQPALNFLEWRLIAKTNPPPGFFVQDQSKSIAFVTGNTRHPLDIRWKGKPTVLKKRISNFNQLPKNLIETINQLIEEGILEGFEPWHAHGYYRFIEKSISPKDDVYVLGYCWSGHSTKGQLTGKRIFEILSKEEIKYLTKDGPPSSYIREFKTQLKQHGMESAEKLENFFGPKTLSQHLLKTKMLFGFQSELAKVLPENPIISNLSEQNLQKSLLQSSWLWIFLGSTIFVLSTASLIQYILEKG